MKPIYTYYVEEFKGAGCSMAVYYSTVGLRTRKRLGQVCFQTSLELCVSSPKTCWFWCWMFQDSAEFIHTACSNHVGPNGFWEPYCALGVGGLRGEIIIPALRERERERICVAKLRSRPTDGAQTDAAWCTLLAGLGKVWLCERLMKLWVFPIQEPFCRFFTDFNRTCWILLAKDESCKATPQLHNVDIIWQMCCEKDGKWIQHNETLVPCSSHLCLLFTLLLD